MSHLLSARRSFPFRRLHNRYLEPVPLDEGSLTELKELKAQIDQLQVRLKEVVARLRDGGATSQEIAEALRAPEA